MTWKPQLTLGSCIPLFSLLIVSVAACNTHAKLAREEHGSTADSPSNPMQRQIDGGTYCVQTLVQAPAPSSPIHFSNKETENDGSSKDFESDLSGDKLDVTVHERHPATEFDRELNTVRGAQPIPIKDGFAESVRTNHYDRSDASGWTMGANSVVLGVTPWGLFVSKPPVTQVGDENISGFDTVKFAIDTRQQSTLDKAALLAAGRLKDYNITGTAWVLKDKNCVLQYDIDFEQDEANGKVSKTHYEGAVSKK